MQNRRSFLKSATLTAAALSLPESLTAKPRRLKKIGIQLFSAPKLLDQDFAGTLRLLAQMGYSSVELYGPYPFSTASAQARWDAVTPALGFKGSGYFGNSADAVKALLKQNRLTTPSIHSDLDTLEQGMDQLGEAAQKLGHQYVILPAIPEEKRQNLDGYKRIADDFNKIGEAAKKVGLKFAYHNHGYGLKEMEGQIPLNLILERTDPKLVFLEMDIFWTTAGGADPVAYLKAFPGRYRLMHLKDMSKQARFSGDGGNPTEWIALFPYMTTLGDGVLDLRAIVQAAWKSGVRHFIVEQDMVANAETALKRSFDFLNTLTLD